MDNRKNTILLTVIAVATLLVAVVGATFAFFTAQGGVAKDVDVTVKTSTIDSATLGTWSAINITADQTTFADGAGNRTGESTGTVSFSASNAATTATDYCYKAVLTVGVNPFVYSAANSSHAAELTLTAVKDSTTIVNAADITTLGNKTLLGSSTPMEYPIPTTAGGSNYIHKITVPAAGSMVGGHFVATEPAVPRTVENEWALTVTLVNLGVNQNDNAGKLYSAAVNFTHVDCTTGNVITD